VSLANILYPPPTKSGLEEFAFANYQHHQLTTSALFRSRGVQVATFNIYPLVRASAEVWLQQHQQWHNAMNSVLHTSGVDLSGVDFNNKEQFDAWIFIHFNEHNNWARLLGV
jgi:hypothetical protein